VFAGLDERVVRRLPTVGLSPPEVLALPAELLASRLHEEPLIDMNRLPGGSGVGVGRS